MNRFARKKGNKYNRKKIDLDGHVFDSKFESCIYSYLKQSPEITNIELQNKVYLTQAKILCKIDFKVTLKDGSTQYIEAKGFKTPVWNIKKRLWRKYGPGELIIYKGSCSRFSIDETIQVIK